MGVRDREELRDSVAQEEGVRLVVGQAEALMLCEKTCEEESVEVEDCVLLMLCEGVVQGVGEALGEPVLLVL